MNFVKNIKSNKAGKGLLIVLIFAFVLSSLSGVIFMTNKYNVVAVDDTKVNINEFVKILNNEKQRRYALNQTEKEAEFLNSREFMFVMVNNLLREKIINKEINFYNIKEPNDVILSKISKESYFYTNNKFDIVKFHKLLDQYGMSEYDYIETIKNSDNINFLISLINNNQTNDFIVDKLFNNDNQYKDVVVFTINKNAIKIQTPKIQKEDIEKYYSDNINSFIIPESRKIDYIELENFTNDDISNMEELLLISDNITEIATKMNTKTKTFGYVDNVSIFNLVDKYGDEINNIFSYKINDFSNIKKIDNKLYVFSVVDIKNEKKQSLEEVSGKIKDILINNEKENQYKEIVSKYIEEFKNKNYTNSVLVNKSFKTTNVKITKNENNTKHKKDFLDNILKLQHKDVSDIFIDNNNIYFGYIKNVGIIDQNSDVFIDKDSIKYEIMSSVADDIYLKYMQYLQTTKYNVKVNYNLLDLIR